ncbi:hypothetical protein Acr_09g0003320 [Actinidia rufa]|uniref:Uncharacterized protein n=1 Tax=Actinidia rufa TaxID=165716 RepID=A0A7J0F636_9ERIC|nr:hypothetical protein Acr_09g0003320 [Actinidia rufa]
MPPSGDKKKGLVAKAPTKSMATSSNMASILAAPGEGTLAALGVQCLHYRESWRGREALLRAYFAHRQGRGGQIGPRLGNHEAVLLGSFLIDRNREMGEEAMTQQANDGFIRDEMDRDASLERLEKEVAELREKESDVEEHKSSINFQEVVLRIDPELVEEEEEEKDELVNILPPQ